MQRYAPLLVLTYGLLVGCGKSATQSRDTTPVNQQMPTTSATNQGAQTTGTAGPSSTASTSTSQTTATRDVGTSGGTTEAGASIAEQDATKPPPDARPLTDTEIAGVTDAANSGEIEEAKIAERKAKNAEVRRFAGMMLTHHRQAQVELTKLGIKKADSPVSIQLDTATASTVDLLKNSTGDFDRVYIDSQVEAHRNVLTLIDSKLLPNAKEPSLRAYLQKIRSQVAAHLQEAELQQQTLSASASTRQQPGHSGSGVAKSKTVASTGSSAR